MSPREEVRLLRRAARRTRTDVEGRLAEALRALDVTPVPDGLAPMVAALEDVEATTGHAWLLMATIGGRLPNSDLVTAAVRSWRTDGVPGLSRALAAQLRADTADRRVHVVTGRTIVDIGDLVSSPLRTGIQRVARGAATEWAERSDVVMAAWTPGFDGLRIAHPREVARALADEASDAPTSAAKLDEPIEVMVPWRASYILPELAVEPARCAALQSLAEHSPTRTGVIGFDCVPLTSSETTAVGFPSVFALNLAAVARFDTVAAISAAAATEYEGWRDMLHGAGLQGPQITVVPLPVHAQEPSPDALAEAADEFTRPGEPMVLCVGSHEPRKNHLALLYAAEVLWRRGLQFRLVFVGGHSWGSEEFTERLHELQDAGRPIVAISRISDRILWALYRLAHVTAFPSLNEGFGLPVAESLAAGTPVITSDYGSMKEVAGDGGALLVDPRSDDALVSALERALRDHELHAQLTAAASTYRGDSWDHYAARLWDAFHAT